MGGIEVRWEDPSKPTEFLESVEEWHHVRGDGKERQGQVYFTR